MQDFKTRHMELRHFTHQHPLILREGLKENDDLEIACYGCDKPIMGPNYSCRDCNYFLHSSCAELPKEIQHWLHPQHPLTLLDKRSCGCNACGDPIRNLTYNCSVCDFDLDLRCVSLPRTIEHCGHEHPFTLRMNQPMFCCDACGNVSEGMSYLCTTCQFRVHLECALLPWIIKLSNHIHPLSLSYSIKPGDSTDCQICDEKVTTEHRVYRCAESADCSISVHFACPTSKGKKNNGRESNNHSLLNLDKDPSASLRRTIEHNGHEHPLSLMPNNTEFHCDACGTLGGGSFSYICTTCQFWVHSECASLPKSLKLEESSSMPVPDESIALITNIVVEKLTSLGEEKVVRELEHFSHRHSMILLEDMENQGKCHGCAEPLLGPTYTCAKCSYSLHKPCAELPREILKHPFHPQHPLALFVNPPYRRAYCQCSACGHDVTHFVYHCSSCNFNLDLRCVSLPCTNQHHGHEHPLTLLQKPAKFSCYACGSKGDGNSYLCTTCMVLFHLECALSPHTIKLDNHHHSLRLCFISSCNHSNKCFCIVCELRVQLDHWHYFCEDCYCAAHLRCATSKKRISRNTTNDGYRLDPLPILDESIFLTTNDVQNNCVRDETITTELSHFSHQHCLNLCHELKTGEQCNGCAQRISGPFYSCSECNFCLHKSCTQLCSEIRHPLHHEHRLKLFARPTNSDWFFDCDMCGNFCSGFSYSCEYCNFNLDIVCSSILGYLKHEAHEHDLTLSSKHKAPEHDLALSREHEAHGHDLALSSKRGEAKPCRACGEDITVPLMTCFACNFNLHIGCATLPHTVWHKIHRHPFTLTYIPIRDESNEYYCDICEEERDPENWIYYCSECDYPAHVRCMVELGSHKRIKLGVVLNIENHKHSVTVVKSEDLCNNSYTIDLYCADCSMAVKSFDISRYDLRGSYKELFDRIMCWNFAYFETRHANDTAFLCSDSSRDDGFPFSGRLLKKY